MGENQCSPESGETYATHDIGLLSYNRQIGLARTKAPQEHFLRKRLGKPLIRTKHLPNLITLHLTHELCKGLQKPFATEKVQKIQVTFMWQNVGVYNNFSSDRKKTRLFQKGEISQTVGCYVFNSTSP